MELFDLLKQGASVSGDNIAVTHGSNNITYKNLILYSDIVAQQIDSFDLPNQSRVGILYENSIEYVIIFFAVLRAGHIAVPLDTSIKADKLNFILNDCSAKILFVQNKFLRYLKEIISDDISVEQVVVERELSFEIQTVKVNQLAKFDEIEKNDGIFKSIIKPYKIEDKLSPITFDSFGETSTELAAIFYTSGSTGIPKGVMLSHRNLISNTAGTIEYLKLNSKDSVIVILPFYYIYGNSLLLTHIMAGGRLVIDNRFAFPQTVLETMKNEKVTGLSGVPSNFMILIGHENFNSEYLPDLTYVTQAGGGLAPDIINKVISALTGKDIFIMYGQTEASPRVTWLPPEKLSEKIGSIGIEIPGVKIKIADENGNEVARGEVGEIIISGDSVMMGYCNQPDEQKEVLKDGWLYSGDLAKQDEDGYIYIVSRKKEILKVGGNRVSAKEIEERILEHELVKEVAIIGVDDEILGEAIKAFVVLTDNNKLDEKDIQNHCLQKLARHKAPKFVEFISELPKYQSGKVNKMALSKR